MLKNYLIIFNYFDMNMNTKGNKQKKVDDLIDQIEEVDNMDEAKSLILQSIKHNCRETAERYFACIDEKSKNLSKRKLSKKKIENMLENEVNPYCMRKFKVVDCLQK